MYNLLKKEKHSYSPLKIYIGYSILYHKLTIALAPSPTLAPTLAFPSLWLILSYFLTLTHTQIQTYSHALFLLIGLVANT